MTIAKILIQIARINDTIRDCRKDPVRFADDLDEALDLRRELIRKLNRRARKLSVKPANQK